MRGRTLAQLLESVRLESGRSSSTTLGQNEAPALIQRINRVYEYFWFDHDWPHLKIMTSDVTVAAEDYQIDPPTDIDLERIEKVACLYNSNWTPVDRGITTEIYNILDSENSETLMPIRRYDIQWVSSKPQIVLWPSPSEETTLRFQGRKAFTRLVETSDVCLLDDQLIYLHVAAELLAKEGDPSAKSVASAAAKRYNIVKYGLNRNRDSKTSLGGAQAVSGRFGFGGRPYDGGPVAGTTTASALSVSEGATAAAASAAAAAASADAASDSADAASDSADEAAASATAADVAKLDWQGSWSAGTYQPNDVVENDGSSWVALAETTEEPSVLATDWDLLAAKGDAGAGGGDVTGPSSSTNGTVVLFDLTTGKLIKEATITGLAKLTSGVLSAASAGTDYVVPSGTVAKATNVAGGSASAIVYQSAADTTAFLAAGTSGHFLKCNGASAPSWAAVPTVAAWVNFDATRNAAGGTDSDNTARYIRASSNVSSVTKLASGVFKIAFTSALPDTSYCITGSCSITQYTVTCTDATGVSSGTDQGDASYSTGDCTVGVVQYGGGRGNPKVVNIAVVR